MIKFENVIIEVNDGDEKRNIIDNVSFELPSNGIISLIGKSGSGKSTILNLISHEVKKSSGKICVSNIDYDNLSDEQEDFIRRKIVSFVSQDNLLFNFLTVEDNINISNSLVGITNEEVQQHSKYAEILGISNFLHKKVEYLSGGEKQRASIYISILRDSLIYLVDEPTSALDYANSIIVLDALKELSKEKLVFISSHDIDLLKKYEDFSIEIDYGKIVKNNIIPLSVEKSIIDNTKSYGIYKIGNKILYHQFFRRTFTLLLLIISMTLTIVTMFNITYDETSFLYNSYKSADCDTFVISDSASLSNNTLLYDELKTYNFKSSYEFYYDCNLITNDDIFKNGSSIAFIKNAIIDNSLNDNEVIITDYLYKQLLNNNYQINNNLIVSSYELKIISIEKTNFNWYDNLNNDMKIAYYDYVNFWYKNIKINKNTFNNLRNKNLDHFEYNDSFYSVNKVSDLWDGSYINGKIELENDECIVDIAALSRLLNITYDSSNKDSYLGEEITLVINNKQKKYIIAGLYAGMANLDASICFSDQEYLNLSSENFIEVEEPFSSIQITNKKEFKKVMNYINKNGNYLISAYSEDTNTCLNEFLFMKKISLYIFIISLLLFASVSIYLNTMLIKSNERSIGILRHLGCSRKNIARMLLVDNLILYGLSLIISSIFYVIYIVLNNNAYINNTSFNNSIMPIRLDIIALFLVLSILIDILTLLINLNILKRKDNKKLLSSY